MNCIRRVLGLKSWRVRQIVVMSEWEKTQMPSDLGVPIEVSQQGIELATWKKNPADLLLSVGWHRIFRQDILEAVPLIINIHPSLLPKYRGWAYNWAVVNGDREHGLTAHIVDQGVDTGPILLQRVFSLSKFDTYRSLTRKLLDAHDDFVPELLEKIQHEGILPVAQNEEMASAPPRRLPKDSLIDPTKTLVELYDQIRASDPETFPAHFFVEGKKVCIKLWRSEKGPDEQDMI